MSDMIDRLSQLSRDAGATSAAALADPATVEVMEHRIRTQVRRRRAVTGAAGLLGAGAMALAAVVVAPILRDVAPVIEPGSVPQVVHTDGTLTVYDDGSMDVVNSAGRVVTVAAPDPGSFSTFTVPSHDKLCASIDPADFDTGWTFHSDGARELLGPARVYSTMGGTRTLVAQAGSTITVDDHRFGPIYIAFDADPEVTPYLALRSTVVIMDGATPLHQQALLDAAPQVVVEGSGHERVAVVTGPSSSAYWYCTSEVHDPPASTLIFYMTVDVFLNDGAGQSTRLATHRSWAGVEFTS